MHRGIGVLLAAAVVFAAVLLAGCGSSSSSSLSGSESSAGDSSNAASGGLATFEEKAQAQYATSTQEQTGHPPSTGPEAQPGKKIVVIPCASAVEGCNRGAKGAEEAAKAIGWQVSRIDGGGEPSKQAAAIETAASSGADGIVLVAIDAKTVVNAVKNARAAGADVVAAGENSAPDEEHGVYNVVVPAWHLWGDQGYEAAAAMYALAEKTLKPLMFTDSEFAAVRDRQAGTVKFIEECKAAGGDCEVAGTTEYLATEIATQLPAKSAAAARSTPGYNTVWNGIDAALVFTINGLQQAGLANPPVFAAGFDGNSQNLDMIREGGFEKVTVGLPLEWVGWGMVDDLNRIFAGEKPVDQGITNKVLTKENAPPSGAWEGDTDFRSEYKKLWGVG